MGRLYRPSFSPGRSGKEPHLGSRGLRKPFPWATVQGTLVPGTKMRKAGKGGGADQAGRVAVEQGLCPLV